MANSGGGGGGVGVEVGVGLGGRSRHGGGDGVGGYRAPGATNPGYSLFGPQKAMMKHGITTGGYRSDASASAVNDTGGGGGGGGGGRVGAGGGRKNQPPPLSYDRDRDMNTYRGGRERAQDRERESVEERERETDQTPRKKLHNYIEAEESIRNDLAVHFTQTGEWSSNFIRGVGEGEEAAE